MLIAQQPTAIDACHAHDASGLSSAQRHLIVRPIGLPVKQLELLQ
mgnify:CR=1 FL=1